MDSQENKNQSEAGKKTARKDKLIGAVLANKFEIVSIIGKGGVGRVYKAIDNSLDTEVAIKVMSNFDERQIARFKREARATRGLDHQNILRIYEYGSDDRYAFIVMELLEGKPLSSLIDGQSSLSLARCVNIIRQAATALNHAHSKEIIHRDVKPSNLFVITGGDSPDLVKVLDFGILKLIGSAAEGQQDLSRSDEIFGTPLYMSPEQINKGDIDSRSDIYSLGCVFYECLTGIPPLEGNSSIETVIKHLSDHPLPLREAVLGADFPEELESIVSKMLEKDPEDRFQSMDEFIEALDDLKDLEKLEEPLNTVRIKMKTGELSTRGILEKAEIEKTLKVTTDEVANSATEEDDTKNGSKKKLVIVLVSLTVIIGIFLILLNLLK